MASTAPVTPAPPRQPRSISGPLVLITIGAILLLRTMNVIHADALWHWFVHYWPVLLIILGLIKLVEHFIAQRS